jgi:hypothetical protein
MKRSFSVFFLALLVAGISSCKKPAGEGGNSTIKGRVWVKDYPGPLEYAGADEEVYIIYGDDVNHSERQRANYEGYYEFKYLRPGKYKIYVYSNDITGTSPSGKEVVTQDVTITDKKQTVEVPTININK